MNRTHFDHRLAGVCEALVVSAVPAVPSNPGERTLYHPAQANFTYPTDPAGRATTSTEYVALVLSSQSSRELLRYF